MLAAFEAAMRQSAKDDSEWRRIHSELTAEPKEVREERRKAAREGRPVAAPNRMSVDQAESLLARFAASDAMYGAG